MILRNFLSVSTSAAAAQRLAMAASRQRVTLRVPVPRDAAIQNVYEAQVDLGDHPKPANEDHLKTGQRS
jgi:hypothetical protein